MRINYFDIFCFYFFVLAKFISTQIRLVNLQNYLYIFLKNELILGTLMARESRKAWAGMTRHTTLLLLPSPQTQMFRITEMRNEFDNRRGTLSSASGLGAVSINLEVGWTVNQVNGPDQADSVDLKHVTGQAHRLDLTLTPNALWPHAIHHQHIFQVQVIE